jgi:multiple sugar transport system ATP-binding protein
MNFLPATIEGGMVKLPIGDLPVPAEAGDLSGKNIIAGIRPEHFEDAALIGDARSRGVTFKAKIDLVESLGADKYAYFDTEGGVEHEALAELAEDAGITETPSAGEHTVVARLEAASRVSRGEEAELWVDTSKMQLFDLETGGTLTAGAEAEVPAAPRP